MRALAAASWGGTAVAGAHRPVPGVAQGAAKERLHRTAFAIAIPVGSSLAPRQGAIVYCPVKPSRGAARSLAGVRLEAAPESDSSHAQLMRVALPSSVPSNPANE